MEENSSKSISLNFEKLFSDNVFEGCISLKEIFIPLSVTYIGMHSFDSCLALEETVFEEPSLVEQIEEMHLKIVKNSMKYQFFILSDSICFNIVD